MHSVFMIFKSLFLPYILSSIVNYFLLIRLARGCLFGWLLKEPTCQIKVGGGHIRRKSLWGMGGEGNVRKVVQPASPKRRIKQSR